MTRFDATVEIEASPDDVWRVMRDVERWPDWTPSMSSVRLVDEGPLAIGSRARVKQPKLPAAEWVVTELQEGRGFTWISRSPGVRATAEHLIEPTSTGSRVTLSVQLGGVLGPLVARATRRMTERYIALEAKGLKHRSEKAPGGG